MKNSLPKISFTSKENVVGSPKIMGILNLTPDSYLAQSRAMEMNKVVDYVGKMVNDGVDILDIGAVSTRPGAAEPSISEELDRLIGPLMAIRSSFPELKISIDTYRTEVLRACIDIRIDLINDISAGRFENQFLSLVAKSNLPYIMMHTQGRASTMQLRPQYQNVVLDLLKFFDERIAYCRSLGIKDIIIDPGFGFGKTIDHNYKILSALSSFEIFDLPILVGISRKSMIYKALDCSPEEALPGSTALHMTALLNGANILRVHDVREAKQCVKVWQLYNKAQISD